MDRNGLRFADRGKARNAHLSEIELKGNEAWLKSERCAMEKEILQPRSRTGARFSDRLKQEGVSADPVSGMVGKGWCCKAARCASAPPTATADQSNAISQ